MTIPSSAITGKPYQVAKFNHQSSQLKAIPTYRVNQSSYSSIPFRSEVDPLSASFTINSRYLDNTNVNSDEVYKQTHRSSARYSRPSKSHLLESAYGTYHSDKQYPQTNNSKKPKHKSRLQHGSKISVGPCERYGKKMQFFEKWRDYKEVETLERIRKMKLSQKPIPEHREAFAAYPYNMLTKAKCKQIQQVYENCHNSYIAYSHRHKPFRLDHFSADSYADSKYSRNVTTQYTYNTALVGGNILKPGQSMEDFVEPLDKLLIPKKVPLLTKGKTTFPFKKFPGKQPPVSTKIASKASDPFNPKSQILAVKTESLHNELQNEYDETLDMQNYLKDLHEHQTANLNTSAAALIESSEISVVHMTNDDSYVSYGFSEIGFKSLNPQEDINQSEHVMVEEIPEETVPMLPEGFEENSYQFSEDNYLNENKQQRLSQEFENRDLNYGAKLMEAEYGEQNTGLLTTAYPNYPEEENFDNLSQLRLVNEFNPDSVFEHEKTDDFEHYEQINATHENNGIYDENFNSSTNPVLNQNNLLKKKSIAENQSQENLNFTQKFSNEKVEDFQDLDPALNHPSTDSAQHNEANNNQAYFVENSTPYNHANYNYNSKNSQLTDIPHHMNNENVPRQNNFFSGEYINTGDHNPNLSLQDQQNLMQIYESDKTNPEPPDQIYDSDKAFVNTMETPATLTKQQSASFKYQVEPKNAYYEHYNQQNEYLPAPSNQYYKKTPQGVPYTTMTDNSWQYKSIPSILHKQQSLKHLESMKSQKSCEQKPQEPQYYQSFEANPSYQNHVPPKVARSNENLPTPPQSLYTSDLYHENFDNSAYKSNCPSISKFSRDERFSYDGSLPLKYSVNLKGHAQMSHASNYMNCPPPQMFPDDTNPNHLMARRNTVAELKANHQNVYPPVNKMPVISKYNQPQMSLLELRAMREQYNHYPEYPASYEYYYTQNNQPYIQEDPYSPEFMGMYYNDEAMNKPEIYHKYNYPKSQMNYNMNSQKYHHYQPKNSNHYYSTEPPPPFPQESRNVHDSALKPEVSKPKTTELKLKQQPSVIVSKNVQLNKNIEAEKNVNIHRISGKIKLSRNGDNEGKETINLTPSQLQKIFEKLDLLFEKSKKLEKDLYRSNLSQSADVKETKIKRPGVVISRVSQNEDTDDSKVSEKAELRRSRTAVTTSKEKESKSKLKVPGSALDRIREMKPSGGPVLDTKPKTMFSSLKNRVSRSGTDYLKPTSSTQKRPIQKKLSSITDLKKDLLQKERAKSADKRTPVAKISSSKSLLLRKRTSNVEDTIDTHEDTPEETQKTDTLEIDSQEIDSQENESDEAEIHEILKHPSQKKLLQTKQKSKLYKDEEGESDEVSSKSSEGRVEADPEEILRSYSSRFEKQISKTSAKRKISSHKLSSHQTSSVSKSEVEPSSSLQYEIPKIKIQHLSSAEKTARLQRPLKSGSSRSSPVQSNLLSSENHRVSSNLTPRENKIEVRSTPSKVLEELAEGNRSNSLSNSRKSVRLKCTKQSITNLVIPPRKRSRSYSSYDDYSSTETSDSSEEYESSSQDSREAAASRKSKYIPLTRDKKLDARHASPVSENAKMNYKSSRLTNFKVPVFVKQSCGKSVVPHETNQVYYDKQNVNIDRFPKSANLNQRNLCNAPPDFRYNDAKIIQPKASYTAPINQEPENEHTDFVSRFDDPGKRPLLPKPRSRSITENFDTNSKLFPLICDNVPVLEEQDISLIYSYHDCIILR